MMHFLQPFHSSTKDKVSAEVSFDEERSKFIRVKFHIERDRESPELSQIAKVFLGTQMVRQHDLWKSNCFELFLKPLGQDLYYEFNWNTEGAWNLYRFDRYRQPQPPTENFEFSLNKKSWDGKILEIEISNQSSYNNFKVGLSAILVNKKGSSDFFALKHPAAEADFHDERGYILEL